MQTHNVCQIMQTSDTAPLLHLLPYPSCLALRCQGFTESWDSTGTVLTCVPEQKNFQHKGIIIAVVVASAAVLAVAFIVWRQYLRTRPRWLRERLLQVRARLCGQPGQHPTFHTLVSLDGFAWRPMLLAGQPRAASCTMCCGVLNAGSQ